MGDFLIPGEALTGLEVERWGFLVLRRGGRGFLVPRALTGLEAIRSVSDLRRGACGAGGGKIRLGDFSPHRAGGNKIRLGPGNKNPFLGDDPSRVESSPPEMPSN